MQQVKVLDADEASGMSRAEALRALATAEGVSEHDRRMAEIMLAGPEIGGADQAILQTRWPMHSMGQAVHWALLQLGAEARAERENAEADLQVLSGGLA